MWAFVPPCLAHSGLRRLWQVTLTLNAARGFPMAVKLLLFVFVFVATIACQTVEQTPEAPSASPTPVSIPTVQVADPTPSPVATKKYGNVAYTMQVPTGWRTSIREEVNGVMLDGNTGKGTHTRFIPPTGDVARLDVVAVRSQSISAWAFDAETYADILLRDMGEGLVAGTLAVELRKTTSKGGVNMVANYQEPGICPTTAVIEILVLSSWLFIVEGAVCAGEFDEYSDLLFDSVNSFAPTDAGKR